MTSLVKLPIFSHGRNNQRKSKSLLSHCEIDFLVMISVSRIKVILLRDSWLVKERLFPPTLGLMVSGQMAGATVEDHGRRPRPTNTVEDHGRRTRSMTTADDHGRRRPTTTVEVCRAMVSGGLTKLEPLEGETVILYRAGLSGPGMRRRVLCHYKFSPVLEPFLI